MTNGQRKLEMKAKVKVKPYCFMGEKKIIITQPERAEQSLEVVMSSDHWPTWPFSQRPVAALQCPQQQRKDTHAPWQTLFMSLF